MKAPESTPEQIIYLVDDDEALRDSLVWLLESQGFKVAAFPSAEDFLRRWRPEFNGCLLLDVRMPGMSGLELHERLRAQYCTLPVIFITGHGDVPDAVRAMKAGAIDFLKKPFEDFALLGAITSALSRVSSEFHMKLETAELQARHDQLTPREKEVLNLAIQGKPNKIIALELGISESTIKVHRHNVMNKMRFRSLPELVIAMQRLKPGA